MSGLKAIFWGAVFTFGSILIMWMLGGITQAPV
jgi:hypothetical protein